MKKLRLLALYEAAAARLRLEQDLPFAARLYVLLPVLTVMTVSAQISAEQLTGGRPFLTFCLLCAVMFVPALMAVGGMKERFLRSGTAVSMGSTLILLLLSNILSDAASRAAADACLIVPAGTVQERGISLCVCIFAGIALLADAVFCWFVWEERRYYVRQSDLFDPTEACPDPVFRSRQETVIDIDEAECVYTDIILHK